MQTANSKDNILFSIIVPTCDRPELLKVTLEKKACCILSENSCSCEVIVSDDGKDTQTKQLIENGFPDFIYTKGPMRGPAANRNNGVRSSRGKWVVFTDDDCLPHLGWIFSI